MSSAFRLTDEEFNYIYDKVPRFNLDLIIKTDNGGVVLIKRSIEPNIGNFHLPGGTLYKGELFRDAAIRIAKNETGLDVEFIKILGSMEFPNEKRGEIFVHTVTTVIELKAVGGELRKDNNAKEIGIFTTLPKPMIVEHANFLQEHNLLQYDTHK